MFQRKKIRYGWYGAVLLWTLVIFSFSLQCADTSTDLSLGFIKNVLDLFSPGVWEKLNSLYLTHLDLIHTIVRKGAHFTEYMILGMLASLAANRTGVPYSWSVAFGYCVLVAAVDETIQRFVEGRYGCVRDVFIDSSGAAVGVLLIFFLMAIREKCKNAEQT